MGTGGASTGGVAGTGGVVGTGGFFISSSGGGGPLPAPSLPAKWLA
jgi:hypothetical protein